MFARLLRIGISGAAYLIAALCVLVSALMIWGHFHIALRGVGSPVFVFCLLTIFLGVPAFATATSFVRRLIDMESGLAFHLSSVSALYVYIAVVLAGILVYPPENGYEGGDIAVRLSLLVAGFGILVNGISSWRRSRSSPTKRSNRSRVKRAPV